MASSFIPYSIPNHNRLANTRIYLKVSWPPKKAELSLDAELLITKNDKKNRLAIVTPRENCHQFVSWMHHESKLNWIWLEFSVAFVERNCAQLLNIYMPQRRWILWKRKNRKSFPFFQKSGLKVYSAPAPGLAVDFFFMHASALKLPSGKWWKMFLYFILFIFLLGGDSMKAQYWVIIAFGGLTDVGSVLSTALSVSVPYHYQKYSLN